MYSDIDGTFDVLASLIPWWLYKTSPSPEGFICRDVDLQCNLWQAFIAKCRQPQAEQPVRLNTTAPLHWTERELELVDVTPSMQTAMQMLLDDCTVRAKPTNRGAGRAFPFQVVKVERNQNRGLWARYSSTRAHVLAELVSQRLGPVGGHQCPSTAAAMAEHNILGEAGLQSTGVGEFYLFHGVPRPAVQFVTRAGLDSRLANSEGYYGSGVYLADDPEKAAVYSYNQHDPIGPRILLLVRTVLGHAHLTTEMVKHVGRRAPCIAGHHDLVKLEVKRENGKEEIKEHITPRPCTHMECHSMVANPPEGRHSRFGVPQVSGIPCREFVVYSHIQCYPEYVIYLEPRK
eukprot:m.170020 g.170020  ORF g.170020 m.170020 type:complete len:346 (-) comp17247_c0_seq27:4405-5442(-)